MAVFLDLHFWHLGGFLNKFPCFFMAATLFCGVMVYILVCLDLSISSPQAQSLFLTTCFLWQNGHSALITIESPSFLIYSFDDAVCNHQSVCSGFQRPYAASGTMFSDYSPIAATTYKPCRLKSSALVALQKQGKPAWFFAGQEKRNYG